MRNRLSLLSTIAILSSTYSFSQDTSRIKTVQDVYVRELLRSSSDMMRLPNIQGTDIFAGKKNEVIKIGTSSADLSTNNSRQLFNKVPGLSIWENDGSGIQTGIATRGLSPNRSWEFNVRQNGTDISSEVFGYPEAYYAPPSEALEKIEIVRGAGSLQYGPQFGGMLNYVTKKALATSPFPLNLLKQWAHLAYLIPLMPLAENSKNSVITPTCTKELHKAGEKIARIGPEQQVFP
jgi:hypothetical protein